MKTISTGMLLVLLLGVTTSCVHRDTEPVAPRFFIRELEKTAVDLMRTEYLDDAFEEGSARRLERMRGWRNHADEAWRRLRKRVDETCEKLGYDRFSDEEAFEVVMCVRNDERTILWPILEGDLDSFINGHAHKVAVAMGCMIVHNDRARLKAIREVARG